MITALALLFGLFGLIDIAIYLVYKIVSRVVNNYLNQRAYERYKAGEDLNLKQRLRALQIQHQKTMEYIRECERSVN